LRKKILKTISTFFLFNVFLFGQGIPPNEKECQFKKEYIKELYSLRKNINLILKDKNYTEVMDSLCIGEKIANRRNYSFRSNLSMLSNHIDSVIGKETNYVNTYCNAYYMDNTFKNVYTRDNTLFKYLNNTLFDSLKRKNYCFKEISYIPCFLIRESRVLIRTSQTFKKDLSDLNAFCGFLKKKYENIKIDFFLKFLKMP